MRLVVRYDLRIQYHSLIGKETKRNLNIEIFIVRYLLSFYLHQNCALLDIEQTKGCDLVSQECQDWLRFETGSILNPDMIFKRGLKV